MGRFERVGKHDRNNDGWVGGMMLSYINEMRVTFWKWLEHEILLYSAAIQAS